MLPARTNNKALLSPPNLHLKHLHAAQHKSAQTIKPWQHHYLWGINPVKTRLRTLTSAYHQDMRAPTIAHMSPKDYQLEKTSPFTSNDEIALESWPGQILPLDLNGEQPAEKTPQETKKAVFEFDHEVAHKLIDDVNAGIAWLAKNQPKNPTAQKNVDAIQTKIIDIIDHYAGHYWLPLLLERFTPDDWSTLVQHAASDLEVAHFLSLLCTQLCYNANSHHFFRLEYALENMRSGGIAMDSLQVETPDSIECEIKPTTMNPASTPSSPVIGYFLRYCPENRDPKHHFWIISLAGTQVATLGSNIEAHLKALLINNKHWGYSEYYRNVIKPSLVQRLKQVQQCEGKIKLPATVHFAGHSMGGALAHFAALDFPPTQIAPPGQNKPPHFIIHSNNSARAGNHELRRELMALGAHCVTSTHVDDIVTTVPPNFLGYESGFEEKPYNNALHETTDKMGLLGKNWRENFIRHSLAVFLVVYAPAPIHKLLLQKGLLLPKPGQSQTLGYKVSGPEKRS